MRLHFHNLIQDCLVPTTQLTQAEITLLAEQVYHKLKTGQLAVVVKLAHLAGSLSDKAGWAEAIVDGVTTCLTCDFDMYSAFTEVDREQSCEVLQGTTRSLLPHHDGGHCSYLTVPGSQGAAVKRSLENTSYTTTAFHKLYQGIFIKEAGNAFSATSYFNLVEIIKAAYLYQHGKPGSRAELLHWYDGNIRSALETTDTYGYLPIGAQIGARGRLARTVPIHHLEAVHHVDSVTYRAEDIAEEMVQTSLGISFGQFMERYCHVANSSTGDLIVGHNLFAWHGGLKGGGNRVISPICIAVKAHDPQYEQWLASNWATFSGDENAKPM